MKKKIHDQYFIDIVNQNKTGLYREAYSYLQNAADAEDAVSNTILKAYEKIETLKDIRKMKAWLYRILVNECKDMIKKRNKWSYVEMSVSEIEYPNNNEEDFDLYDVVCSLESPFKEISLLFYFENFKIKEIADILNLPDGTVKSRLARARKQIKKIMLVH
ncbi:MAG: sigma-70 family RNA polymerase sigma factor [Clostridium sp.]|nr:sigma-70 family RNA polymerase sigma factor [Clostridium sp.]